MKTPASPNESTAAPGLIGHLQPRAEHAVRAVRAMREGRLADAEKHIVALQESSAIELAWKRFLEGRLACERGGFEFSETPLRQAAALAFEAGLSPPNDPLVSAAEASACILDPDGIRLAAAAYEEIGLSLRRQDRPAEAYRAHLIASRLRFEQGSVEEQWESAVSLGLAAELACDAPKAEKWYRTALTIAQRVTQKPAEKRAIAWTHLSASLADGGRFDEAVSAARAARDLWLRHDVSSLAAARADLHLAHALIRLSESLLSAGTPHAADAVREAASLLEVAKDALSAFGPPAAADSARCHELVDFARRLLATCQP